jgi:hypothetical protein
MARWLATLAVLVLVACGQRPVTTAQPTVIAAPSATPIPTQPAAAAATSTAPPRAAPQATATPTSRNVWVGNTDGQGVFVRRTPRLSDRLKAYPDGTLLRIIGDDEDGDGTMWHHVAAPDGVEGFIPVQYTLDRPPPTAMATAVPTPKPTAVPVATPRPAPAPTLVPPTNPRSCCRICTTGQACGNTCISRSFTCHQGIGCACNGGVLDHLAEYSPDDQVYVLNLARLPSLVDEAYVLGVLDSAELRAQEPCPSDDSTAL